jgi:hypothetical protein
VITTTKPFTPNSVAASIEDILYEEKIVVPWILFPVVKGGISVVLYERKNRNGSANFKVLTQTD